MKNEITKIGIFIHEFARKLFSLMDYLIWILFDLSKFKKIKTQKIRKILIVLINQEKGNIGGDFVTLGGLNCFKKQYPKIELSILSNKSTIKQFENLGQINAIEYNGEKSLDNLKKEEFDAVIF